MKKIPVTIEQTPEGDWWVRSSQFLGTFICGETRSEVLENARELFAVTMGVDESDIELDIIETRISADGEDP
jgi:predicted RNase H-like HicB family nuclease